MFRFTALPQVSLPLFVCLSGFGCAVSSATDGQQTGPRLAEFSNSGCLSRGERIDAADERVVGPRGAPQEKDEKREPHDVKNEEPVRAVDAADERYADEDERRAEKDGDHVHRAQEFP